MREADTIQVLGRGTSVDFTIDDSVPFEIAERRLRDYLEVCRGLYSSGTVSVNVGRRILAPDQLSAIKDILDNETGLTVTRYWCAPETLQQAFYSLTYGGSLSQRDIPPYGRVNSDANLTPLDLDSEAEEYLRHSPAGGVAEGRQLALGFADLQPLTTTPRYGKGEPQAGRCPVDGSSPRELTQDFGSSEYGKNAEETHEVGAARHPTTVDEGKSGESRPIDNWDDHHLPNRVNATVSAEDAPVAPENPDLDVSEVDFPLVELAVSNSLEEEESAPVEDEWRVQPGWNVGGELAEALHPKDTPETGTDDASEQETGEDAVPQDGRRGNHALIVKNTCRSGEVVRYEGDVVVFGDVNPGAVIIANGDIVVLGVLRGLAHAGADGDPKATIFALNLETQRLQIGQHVGEAPRGGKRTRSGNRGAVPQIAYLRRSSVFVAPFTRRREEYQGGVLYEG